MSLGRKTRHKVGLLFLSLPLIFLTDRPAFGEDRRLPVRLRIVILFKALTYDRNLAKQRKHIHLGIICNNENIDSQIIARLTANEMSQIQHKWVKGLALHYSIISVNSGKAAREKVNKLGVNLIYLSTEVDHLLPELKDLVRSKKILITSGEASHIRQGAGLSVVLRDRKPKILVNLPIAKSQGALFDARLLNLSEVIF